MLAATWHLLQDAAIFIVIGLLAGGMLKVYLSPAYVAAHLGAGRFASVLKAALLGIPLPLCSCGVLPAAAALKKQGANNGAITAFLISTPETGVDSISVSWALLDPLMTVFRPVAAFITAMVAGISENLLQSPRPADVRLDSICTDESCCGNSESCAAENTTNPGVIDRIMEGVRYAATELWAELAIPFFIGLLLAGVITVVVPEEFFTAYLGGGFTSMLVMLVFGIPLYICATASTPIAAAFIIKGVSPGAALVFLLVGPATNLATVSVLTKLVGKRATAVYLLSIAVVSVLCGLALDHLYVFLGISAQAAVGQAAEITPEWLRTAASLLILALSVRPLYRSVAQWFGVKEQACSCSDKSCSKGHPTRENSLTRP